MKKINLLGLLLLVSFAGFAQNVGIGTTAPASKLHIFGGTEATYAPGSGYLLLGDQGFRNLVFDHNEILARNNGQPYDLRLQSQGGRVGIGQPFPLAKLHITDGSLLLSTPGVANTSAPNIGILPAGNHFYWSHTKNAFVGGLYNQDINSDNLALHSFAYGYNALATGFNATALGRYSKALGYASTAMGDSSVALGNFRFAAGYKDSANGNYSTAIGVLTTASNNYSTALGYYSTAAGEASTAMGYQTTASGQISTAMGINTIASGYYSTAIGASSTASGQISTAMGASSTASGQFSTAMGSNTTASANYSTAMGDSTSAIGFSSTSMGDHTTARSKSSTAMGSYTTASGYYSTAMGYYTIAKGRSSLVIGNYNDSILLVNETSNTINPLTPLFIIGNGTSEESRSNAMVVKQNGKVGIGTNFPDTKLHLVGGTDASLATGSGYMVTGNTTGANLVFDENEILARNNGTGSNLFLQNGSGNLGIGAGTANAKVHISNGSDANYNSTVGGYIILGNSDGTNIVFDDDEIIARNNNTASNLHLQSGSGNVIIGTGSGQSYEKLSVIGNAAKTTGGSSWVVLSDARLKQNINPYKDGLKELLRINPVTFNYTPQSGCDATQTNVGVLAQDIKKIAPYMVKENKMAAADGNNYLSLDNSAMTYMLINAVKEQQAVIEELNKRIKKLENKF